MEINALLGFVELFDEVFSVRRRGEQLRIRLTIDVSGIVSDACLTAQTA